MKMNLKPCPFCGNVIDEEKELYLPERDWKPSFYDPDSGGDPISIVCKCGLQFSTGTYEWEEFVKAWNMRSNNANVEFTPDDVAHYLNDGDRCNDEDFAGIFVMFHKLRNPGLYDQSVESVTKEDMLSADIDAITSEINTILSEIIPIDSECDCGAWWKGAEA